MDWYRTNWDDVVEDMPWSGETLEDIRFLDACMKPSEDWRILDLACGAGRHAIELAKRGHDVVGVDISPHLIARAREAAHRQGVEIEFVCANIVDLDFDEEFDAVLNLWEGAIGYLATDSENLQIFSVISTALRPGGHHLAGPLLNADYFQTHGKLRSWDMNEHTILLADVVWVEETRRIRDTTFRLRAQSDRSWNLYKAESAIEYRIYGPREIKEIFSTVNLHVTAVYRHPQKTLGVGPEDEEFWVQSTKATGAASGR